MPKQKRTQSRQRELYRVRNWLEYEKALVQRGSITFWLSADFEQTWLYTGEKQRGSQFDYSDKAIKIMVTINEVFHLTNRGVDGFVPSLFQMMNEPRRKRTGYRPLMPTSTHKLFLRRRAAGYWTLVKRQINLPVPEHTTTHPQCRYRIWQT